MNNKIDLSLIGRKFGQLTILEFDCRKNKQTMFLCLCECGNKKSFNISNVKRGLTQSCGCTRYKKTSEKQKKYNHFYEKENYIVGITSNTQKEFLIDKEDFDKIKRICWGENKHRVHLGIFKKWKKHSFTSFFIKS